ncbi:MAG: ATP synthase subunit I [Legionellaceae bacterium]
MKNKQGEYLARDMLKVHISVVMLATVLFIPYFGAKAISTGLLSGVVYCLPHVLFARIFFKEQRVSRSKHIVGQFYKAEAYKLVLSAALFALAFGVLEVVPEVFFSVYVLVQLSAWFAPWLLLKKQTK